MILWVIESDQHCSNSQSLLNLEGSSVVSAVFQAFGGMWKLDTCNWQVTGSITTSTTQQFEPVLSPTYVISIMNSLSTHCDCKNHRIYYRAVWIALYSITEVFSDIAHSHWTWSISWLIKQIISVLLHIMQNNNKKKSFCISFMNHESINVISSVCSSVLNNASHAAVPSASTRRCCRLWWDISMARPVCPPRWRCQSTSCCCRRASRPASAPRSWRECTRGTRTPSLPPTAWDPHTDTPAALRWSHWSSRMYQTSSIDCLHPDERTWLSD